MFNLKQYHDKSRHLHGLLPWAFMIEPGTIVDKDGSFLKAFEFRGPDLESVTEYELKTKAAQVNNALKRLEDGWGIFIEAQRFKSRKYPQSTFPDPVSRAIDRERAATLTKEKFESRYFLALAYLPPSEQSAKLTQKMIENRSGSEKVDYNDYLVSLKNDIKQIYGILNNVFAFLEPLEGDGLLTYLHSCVSTKRHTVRMPAVPTYLDAYITDQGLTPGLEPRLGEKFFRILTLKGFPMEGYPGMLDALNRLDLPFTHISFLANFRIARA